MMFPVVGGEESSMNFDPEKEIAAYEIPCPTLSTEIDVVEEGGYGYDGEDSIIDWVFESPDTESYSEQWKPQNASISNILYESSCFFSIALSEGILISSNETSFLYEFPFNLNNQTISIIRITDSFDSFLPYVMDEEIINGSSLLLWSNVNLHESPDIIDQELIVWYTPLTKEYSNSSSGFSDINSSLEINGITRIGKNDELDDKCLDPTIDATREVKVNIYNINKESLPYPGRYYVDIYRLDGVQFETSGSVDIFSTTNIVQITLPKKLETGVDYQIYVFFKPSDSRTLKLKELWGKREINFGYWPTSYEYDFIRDHPCIDYIKFNGYYPPITIKQGEIVNIESRIRWDTTIWDFFTNPTTAKVYSYIKLTDSANNHVVLLKIPETLLYNNIMKGSSLSLQTTYKPKEPGKYYFVPYLESNCHDGSDRIIDQGLRSLAFTVDPIPPVAAFTASPTTGTAPLTVQFTDQSSNTPTSWKWEYSTGSTWT
ncbi:hypothetical protein FTO68_11675, partial [Methanocalculus taiwanensis]|nr:hypothetical protein [Methanocalculus taiwanensis]